MPSLQQREPRKRWSLDDIVVTDPPIIRRAIGAAAIGNITEWYDFGVYGFFLATMNKVFFAGLDPTMGSIAGFGIFAAAFLARPFGGLIFGPLADRIGRTKVLATTMIMMALGTFLIGCIPSPAAIGSWAVILLIACRLIQGFSTGGEYGNAMTFIAEYAPDRRRGFLGSWLEFGTFIGYVIGASAASLVSLVLSEEQLLSWGWRLPFLIALPLGIVGVYLRSRLADTPAFQQIEAEAEAKEKEYKASEEARDLLKLWPFILLCMGGVIAWNVTSYMLTSYMPTYVSSTLPEETGAGLSTSQSDLSQIIVMLVAVFLVPALGLLSDRIGRRPIILAGSIGVTVLAIPMFWLIQSHSVVAVFAGLLLMGLCLICFASTMPSTLPSFFPTKARGAGLSITFNVAISLFCGTTGVISSGLVAGTGNVTAPAFYLMFGGIVGIVSVLFIREPNGRRMWGSAPAAVDEAEAREIVQMQGTPEGRERGL